MPKRYIGVLLVILYLLVPLRAHAENYDVTATVAAQLPPTLPLVTGPQDNTSQQNDTIFISGTCTIVVPTLIVVLIRQDQVIGSGNCLPNGTFRILVSLVLGANTIYPKFLTITGESSGLGSPITVFYDQAAQAVPQDTKPPKNEDLRLGFDYDFVSYNDEAPTKLSFSIFGGRAPYEIIISWGDETKKKITVNEPGVQRIEHFYRNILPPTSITIQATDAEGKKVSQSRALISFKKGVYIPPAQPLATKEFPLRTWSIGAGSFAAILAVTYFVRPELFVKKPIVRKPQVKKSKK